MPPEDSSPSRSWSAALVEQARVQVRGLTPGELRDAQRAGAVVVDLREAEEIVQSGIIPGALHVPRGVLEFAADPDSPVHRAPLDPTRPVVLYCAVGGRSALAALTLQAMGYGSVAHLAGGVEGWLVDGHPLLPWPEASGVSEVTGCPREPLKHGDQDERRRQPEEGHQQAR
ncbi:MAG: rhodanese-like domain-containing protein [Gemmatimonadaceae bacterium]|nr:rhodanese-like domain-containing protein [Gemmatimonadaceae bacterium]NUO95627.1 rhodanese-like domain-containing protein [Gemmatimonadaceae bacterium]NUP56580.1 rhodanese-like domain-containing protein [Gemmatimonadaceae bacterium]NUR33587.1 rhodanese-like domain-containing protein [Gemmatimonadaceae bacterium]HWJ32388.1 rhodanese-like domain-containing protein [Gaiellaceae bacterium]